MSKRSLRYHRPTCTVHHQFKVICDSPSFPTTGFRMLVKTHKPSCSTIMGHKLTAVSLPLPLKKIPADWLHPPLCVWMVTSPWSRHSSIKSTSSGFPLKTLPYRASMPFYRSQPVLVILKCLMPSLKGLMTSTSTLDNCDRR